MGYDAPPAYGRDYKLRLDVEFTGVRMGQVLGKA